MAAYALSDRFMALFVSSEEETFQYNDTMGVLSQVCPGTRCVFHKRNGERTMSVFYVEEPGMKTVSTKPLSEMPAEDRQTLLECIEKEHEKSLSLPAIIKCGYSP
jgi:hypothetical protein